MDTTEIHLPPTPRKKQCGGREWLKKDDRTSSTLCRTSSHFVSFHLYNHCESNVFPLFILFQTFMTSNFSKFFHLCGFTAPFGRSRIIYKYFVKYSVNFTHELKNNKTFWCIIELYERLLQLFGFTNR